MYRGVVFLKVALSLYRNQSVPQLRWVARFGTGSPGGDQERERGKWEEVLLFAL